VVLCVETLEHVYPTDHVLAEILRVLKPGGVAIIDVPRLDSFLNIGLLLFGFQPPGVECSRVQRYGSINDDSVLTGHVAYFTRRALVAMIRATGLDVRSVRQVGQRSGWLKLQEVQNRPVRPLVRLAWWVYDVLSLKKEYLVVLATKPATPK
jgi:SAM-dependent methyltransferase